jgi:hypothetical protein
MKGTTQSGKVCTITIEDAQAGQPLEGLLMEVRYYASNPVPTGTIAHGDPGDRGLASSIHVVSSGDVWVQQPLPLPYYARVGLTTYALNDHVDYRLLKSGYRYTGSHGVTDDLLGAVVEKMAVITPLAPGQDPKGWDVISNTRAGLSDAVALPGYVLPNAVLPPSHVDPLIEMLVPRLEQLIRLLPGDVIGREASDALPRLLAWKSDTTGRQEVEIPFQLLHAVVKDAQTGRELSDVLTVISWRESDFVHGDTPSKNFHVVTSTAYRHSGPVELMVGGKVIRKEVIEVLDGKMPLRWGADVYFVRKGYEPVKIALDEALKGVRTELEIKLKPADWGLIAPSTVRELKDKVLPKYTGPQSILKAVQEALQS